MFKSLKDFIDSRLGTGIVQDEVIFDDAYFIKIHCRHLIYVLLFLKSDPDVRLNLFDQIVVLPKGSRAIAVASATSHTLMYQFKSLKLPYRVSLLVEVERGDEVPSITVHFTGARWPESDIRQKYGITIEENDRDR